MEWESLEQGLGVEMESDEEGVLIERCIGHVVPWS